MALAIGCDSESEIDPRNVASVADSDTPEHRSHAANTHNRSRLGQVPIIKYLSFALERAKPFPGYTDGASC